MGSPVPLEPLLEPPQSKGILKFYRNQFPARGAGFDRAQMNLHHGLTDHKELLESICEFGCWS